MVRKQRRKDRPRKRGRGGRGFVFHTRIETETAPGGITVSRGPLPEGVDIRITEYVWPDVTLWFSDADKFTEDERESARRFYVALLAEKDK